jgi:hypothetical protein
MVDFVFVVHPTLDLESEVVLGSGVECCEAHEAPSDQERNWEELEDLARVLAQGELR